MGALIGCPHTFSHIVFSHWSHRADTEKIHCHWCLLSSPEHSRSKRTWNRGRFSLRGMLDAYLHSNHKKREQTLKTKGGWKQALCLTLFGSAGSHGDAVPKLLARVTITTYSKEVRKRSLPANKWRKKSFSLLLQYVHAVLSARALIWADQAD